jgi:hypothetical protein
MNWKIFLPLVFAALLFVGGSTTALADNYWAGGRSDFNHRVSPYYRYYGDGHDYRWYKHGGRGYHHDWRYYGKYDRFRSPFADPHYTPYPWHGGPFFGGTFFLPGLGVVFGGHGRW